MFNELTTSLSQASKIYDNFIEIGDFYIDVNLPRYKHDKLEEFCNHFDLSNLIKSNTCFTKTHSSETDLILTNNSKFFQKSGTTETGSSDFHRLISTLFQSHFSRLSPKAIYYRNHTFLDLAQKLYITEITKNFDQSKLIEDLINTAFLLKSDDPDENYSFLTKEYPNIAEKHALLREKCIRGDHAPFMKGAKKSNLYKI